MSKAASPVLPLTFAESANKTMFYKQLKDLILQLVFKTSAQKTVPPATKINNAKLAAKASD